MILIQIKNTMKNIKKTIRFLMYEQNLIFAKNRNSVNIINCANMIKKAAGFYSVCVVCKESFFIMSAPRFIAFFKN